MPAAIIYLRQVGVGKELNARVAAALSGKGFRTEIGMLSVDPFKGFVAKDVAVWETSGDERNLARIERLVVSMNLTDLLAGRITVDHVRLDETDVSVPLGSPAGQSPVDVNGVSAELFMLNDDLRISSLEGQVQGINVILSGSLRNLRAFHLQHAATQKVQGPPEILDRIVETLSTLKFPGAPPELRLKINGDLADLTTLRAAPISLRSGPIITPEWRVDGVEAEADYENQTLDVKRLNVRIGAGTLNLSGQWKDGALDFELSSSVKPEAFSRLLPRESPFKELKFSSAPQLVTTGRAEPSPAGFNTMSPARSRLGSSPFAGWTSILSRPTLPPAMGKSSCGIRSSWRPADKLA